MRESIGWWAPILKSSAPRRVSFGQRRPVLVYTDACGAGEIGALLVLPGGRRIYARTHLSAWIATSNEKITEYEMDGRIMGVSVALDHITGSPILLCCDNQCARAILKRGSSDTRLGRTLAATFWNIASASGGMGWVGYVRSNLNPSGHAPRISPGCGEKDSQDVSEYFKVRNLCLLVFESFDSFELSRFKLPTFVPGFGDSWSCA